MRNPLGQILCQKGWLEPSQLDQALADSQSTGKRLGQVLVERGWLKPAQLIEALVEQAQLPTVSLHDKTIPPDVLRLVPPDWVSQYKLMPIDQQDGVLTVAMADPFDPQALADVRLLTGLSVRRCYCPPTELERAILRHYGSNVARMLDTLAPQESSQPAQTADQTETLSAAKLHELARQPSLVNLVNVILLEAIEARASDIHIEPFEKDICIKYRIDGMLIEKSRSPKRLGPAIVSRIKIMANMNIAERFVPQDGHIEFNAGDNKIDIRVSTVPTIFGESVVLRLLDRRAALLTLDQLGMTPTVLAGFKQCLAKAHGIVLVTGPTGSGKTTTLYASLNHIYDPSLKIITIEDPVEYQLDGIVQIPVNPRRGLTFSRGLRHILRQDPNIIMVGEIRDKETADIAIRAALTGHLVFSTLHTNDAPGAVTRLIDMGVEPFLLASSLEGVLAQRLVRKICPACKQPYQPPTGIVASVGNHSALDLTKPLYHGVGCEACNRTGMSGRLGIFELLRVTEPLRKLIANRPTSEQIAAAAPADYIRMRQVGLQKVAEGITTIEEVLRVTQASEED